MSEQPSISVTQPCSCGEHCTPPPGPSEPEALCSDVVVRARDLSFSYEGQEKALDKVSFAIHKGSFSAIIGPNGGGKTTLLKLMLGLLRPQEGSLTIFGVEPEQAGHTMGYVPQFSTMQQDFPASVLEMVLMGAARPSFFGGSWGKSRHERERAMHHIEVLGLKELANRRIGDLSGGQRQRALVARALMSRPQLENLDEGVASFLLLLDEPTSSIDQEGKFCFYDFLAKLRGSITLVVVSHDLFMISPFFDNVIFVNKHLSRLSDGEVSPENLTLLFGRHLHECPVADFQHGGRALHSYGCTHPACSPSCLPRT